MPARLVQEENRMRIRLELSGEVGQKDVHGLRGGLRQGKREGLVGAGAAGGKEIEALEPFVG
jgi:hypothetical protein